jgi:hypothetical protein
MTQNSMYSDKSRYIHHKQNTIKHLISNGVIFIDYVKSKENIVEHHMKDLMRELMYGLSKGMGLKLLKMKAYYDGNLIYFNKDLKV